MNRTASRPPESSADTPFGHLWLARDVVALGDWILFVGMLVYVSMFTESPATVGTLVTIVLAPRFILWPIVSRVVTWRNALAFGLAAQIMRAAILIPAFLLQREDGAQPILMMAFGYAVAGPFFGAAQRALFAKIVTDEKRSSARKALLNTWLITLAVGPAFGYAVYSVAGLKSAAVATLVALLVSSAMLFLSRPSRMTDEASGPELLVGFSPLPTGIMPSFRDPGLQQIAAIQVIAAVLAGGLVVLEAAYTTNGLFLSIENMGILLASQGLGVAAGGLYYQQVARGSAFNSVVATGLALIGAGELGLSISSALPAGMGFTAIIGAGIGLLAVSMSDLAQGVLPADSLRKPPTIAVRTVVDGAILLSAVVAAPLCQSISPRFALVLAGMLVWVLALYSFGAVPAGEEQGSAVPQSLSRR